MTSQHSLLRLSPVLRQDNEASDVMIINPRRQDNTSELRSSGVTRVCDARGGNQSEMLPPNSVEKPADSVEKKSIEFPLCALSMFYSTITNH